MPKQHTLVNGPAICCGDTSPSCEFGVMKGSTTDCMEGDIFDMIWAPLPDGAVKFSNQWLRRDRSRLPVLLSANCRMGALSLSAAALY